MIRHWKIRDMRDRTAYYVTVRELPGVSVLDQVASFMKEHAIPPEHCRIVENSSRFLNLTFKEFVMQQLAMK